MIRINIEITPHNKISVALRKFSSKTEDIFLNAVLVVTNYWQPKFLMDWMDRYTQKRLSQLRQENTKSNWTTVCLKEAVKQIRSQQ